MSKQDGTTTWSDIRIGLISFIALIFMIVAIAFAGGDKGLLFKKRSEIKARLVNVGGLKKGSSVTMGGMPIGTVARISFVGISDANPIEVTMHVRSDMREKIKSDSIPTVRTQGMLGDRYMDLSFGTKESDLLEEGKALIGKSATDFDETLHQAIDVLGETEKLLKAINEKKGSVGEFFYDEKFYTNLVQITDQLNELVQDFKKNPRKYIKFSVF